jgi:hypothetical protein
VRVDSVELVSEDPINHVERYRWNRLMGLILSSKGFSLMNYDFEAFCALLIDLTSPVLAGSIYHERKTRVIFVETQTVDVTASPR